MDVSINLTKETEADISFLDDGDIAITIGDLTIEINYDLNMQIFRKLTHYMMGRSGESVEQTCARILDPHDEEAFNDT